METDCSTHFTSRNKTNLLIKRNTNIPALTSGLVFFDAPSR